MIHVLLPVHQERELQMKARQAQAYEAMKGQFEGLLGRLQVRKVALVGAPVRVCSFRKVYVTTSAIQLFFLLVKQV